MSSLSKKKAAIRPVMNVTPLVDVVLVLLIIFMVVLPMMEHSIQVLLPSIFNVDEENRGRVDPFTLTVSRDGTMFFEQERLDAEAFETRLREANRREPYRRLVLRADQSTRYRDVRSLFHICQEIGFPGVSLRVSERGGDDRELGS
jgi:biopolymer transport protein ExbD/biopolymer transport protein TolR